MNYNENRRRSYTIRALSTTEPTQFILPSSAIPLRLRKVSLQRILRLRHFNQHILLLLGLLLRAESQTTVSGDDREISLFLFQRISVLLFRFNSVLLFDSFELGDRLEL